MLDVLFVLFLMHSLCICKVMELIRLPGCFRKYSATWKIPPDRKFSGSVVSVLHVQPNILGAAGERLIVQTSIYQLKRFDKYTQ